MKIIPVSELLLMLADKNKNREFVSLGEINEYLSERGFALLMILFAFPMAIPLPYPPGFTTILGLPLLIFSIQMLFGFPKPVLPNWIANKNIKSSHLVFAIEKSNKYFKMIEKFLRPRMEYFSSSAGEKMIGFVSLLSSITIALPIWGGNALPSAGIVIMALGLLDKDGVVVIIGVIVSLIGLFVAYLIVYLVFYGATLAAGSFLQDIYLYIMSNIGIFSQ